MEEETTNLGYKNKTLTLFSKGVNSSVLWERQTVTEGEENRQPHWPITSSSPEHTTLCYLTPHFCFSVGEYSIEGRLWATLWTLPQQGTQPLACTLRDWLNLFSLQAETDSRAPVSHVGIWISQRPQFPFNDMTVSAFKTGKQKSTDHVV